jgi:zinc-binding alcohol dehydrogenase family protein
VRGKQGKDMKAIGFFKSGSSSGGEVLRDIDLPKPAAKGRDLLVKIEAVSVNPVDVKTRARVPADKKEPTILGFDAAGVVESVGEEVTKFKPGDEVFYAGSLTRDGTYSEYHLVDERIVGSKPRSLGFPEAAAVPLTSITSWEMLFHRLAIPEGSSAATVLIIGGTGGVGSMAVQLARQLTRLTVIATSFDDPKEQEWCRMNGSDHVIDHMKPIAAQIAVLKVAPVRYVFSTNMTAHHYPQIAALIAPQGRFGLIDDPEPLDLKLLKVKSVSVHWENMFTRSVFQTEDMEAQHQLLTRLSQMIDRGQIRTTLAEVLGPISAANLAGAHERIWPRRAPGKMVMVGF